MDDQARETGEARLAARLHCDDVALLRGHAGELGKVCTIAFADEPGLLVQLGLR